MYIGNDLSRGRSTLYYFDASGGETAITSATRPAVNISYTVGWVAVYLNGVRLHDTDFTANTGNSITGLSALTAGDVVIIEAHKTFSILDQEFPSGTKMLFQQTAAPTGWTKVTSSNDVALRVVSGSVGSGGSVAFETAFASQTVPVHTLTTAEMPSHNHTMTLYETAGSGGTTGNRVSTAGSGYYSSVTNAGGIALTGGGGSHGHGSIDLDVQYVDVIIATKD